MSLPNYNPSNLSSMNGVISEVLKNFALTLENCLPAVVVAYDRANNTVEVQPAINTILTDGTAQARDTIKLPVHMFGGGGLVISAPLKAGDTGWIIASDRDTSLFKQSLSVSNPNTYRAHKLSFGFFVPDKVKGASIDASDSDAMVIQTLDGKTKIALQAGKVAIQSSADVSVKASNLTIEASNVSIKGQTAITGNLTVNGTITATVDVLAGGISGKSHVHSGGTIEGKTGSPE